MIRIRVGKIFLNSYFTKRLGIKISSRKMHLLQNKAFINGQWVSALDNKTFDVINPATEKVVGCVPDMTSKDCEVAIDSANAAFYDKTWSNSTAKDRSDLLKKWFHLMEKNRQEIANIMTEESGKPINEALGEITYGNSFVEWFAEEARRIYGEIVPSPNASRQIMMIRQPIGVCGLITPWNFPHAMITRKAAAALAAGQKIMRNGIEDIIDILII